MMKHNTKAAPFWLVVLSPTGWWQAFVKRPRGRIENHTRRLGCFYLTGSTLNPKALGLKSKTNWEGTRVATQRVEYIFGGKRTNHQVSENKGKMFSPDMVCQDFLVSEIKSSSDRQGVRTRMLTYFWNIGGCGVQSDIGRRECVVLTVLCLHPSPFRKIKAQKKFKDRYQPIFIGMTFVRLSSQLPIQRRMSADETLKQSTVPARYALRSSPLPCHHLFDYRVQVGSTG